MKYNRNDISDRLKSLSLKPRYHHTPYKSKRYPLTPLTISEKIYLGRVPKIVITKPMQKSNSDSNLKKRIIKTNSLGDIDQLGKQMNDVVVSGWKGTFDDNTIDTLAYIKTNLFVKTI
ncbi:hypothetical protein HDV04_005021 [Boothiomyces sp. JEL0838]|nr:hypothetical protein HDV04_005021 [Boothiomyces sp. JEL0838]